MLALMCRKFDSIVELSPDSPDFAERSLRQRIRQQEILAELGVLALQGAPFIELLNHTARLAACACDHWRRRRLSWLSAAGIKWPGIWRDKIMIMIGFCFSGAW